MAVIPTVDEATRQQALAQLVDAARRRGDRGSSTAAMAGILGGADLGRAENSAGIWATRANATQAAAQSMLAGTSAALAAARAQRGAGGVGRGGGGGAASSPYSPLPNQKTALDLLYEQLYGIQASYKPPKIGAGWMPQQGAYRS